MSRPEAASVERLEAELSRYRDLFESAPDAYLVTDPGGRILDVNRAAEELLRRERALLVGRRLVSLLTPGDVRAFDLMFGHLLGLESVGEWELNLQVSDEDVLPVSVSVSAVCNDEGEVESLRWLVRDIAERKRAEHQVLSENLQLERRVQERTAALEETAHEKDDALARLEAVLDQIPAGIVIAEASGRAVNANEEAVRLLHELTPADEAQPDSWLFRGFRPDGSPYPLNERPLKRALRTGRPVPIEPIVYERRDGRRGTFEVSAAPVYAPEGQVIAAVVVFWDVTERERRARTEREFVANAAHELRTPLAALASAVEVLQAGAKDDPVHRDRFLRHVEEQCDRLQRLVRTLLVLARAQTGGEEARTEAIDVRALLGELSSHAPDRLRVDVNTPPGVAVLANRDLAEQALLNLISNALKYAPEGEIVLAGRHADGLVTLEVSDSGPGMEPEERRRALERFYRGKETHVEREGFGLGLPIAAQIAETLGGRLEILAGNGSSGTTVRLLLPATPTAR